MSGDAAAVRRFRARQRGEAPALAQCSCGRTCWGAHAPLCSRCWQLTPAGKAEAVARRRDSRRAGRGMRGGDL
jgi:hypothetical protein